MEESGRPATSCISPGVRTQTRCELHPLVTVRLRYNISLTQPQYWIESTLKSRGQASTSVICFIGDTDNLPKCANHLVNLEDDYLAGWLSVISSHVSRPIEELPFFGALPRPEYSHDCLAQLQVMGLVEAVRDRIGFRLMEKGARVMWAYQYLASISLSGISALSDVNVSLGNNMARSAAHLSFGPLVSVASQKT